MRMRRETKSKFIQIRLRPSELENLKHIVEQEGFLTVSEIVRFSIRKYLSEINLDNR